MGLARDETLKPPRLSKRERNYYCFHLDLSTGSQGIMPSLIKYIQSYGARYSAFLDINVTHIVTDKPKESVLSLPLVQKFQTKLITLSDLLQKIVGSYKRHQETVDAGLISTSVHPLSPTLERAAQGHSQDQNLSQMLAQERQKSVATIRNGNRLMTPLYDAARNSKIEGNLGCTQLATVGGKKVYHKPFTSPYFILQEINHLFAPIYKSYGPNSVTTEDLPKYPSLHYDTLDYHCPFVAPNKNARAKQDSNSRPVLVPQARRPRRPMNFCNLSGSKTHTAPTIVHYKMVPKGIGKAPLPVINLKLSSGKSAPERPRPGFCECCFEKYSNLEEHVMKESHRNLACNQDFYRAVDKVVENVCRLARCLENDLPASPPSPAKSLAATKKSPLPNPLRPSPLKNISNNLNFNGLSNSATTKKQNKQITTVATQEKENFMNLMEIESDSPIYSSPSFKRRRSQRLVGKCGRITTKFDLEIE